MKNQKSLHWFLTVAEKEVNKGTFIELHPRLTLFTHTLFHSNSRHLSSGQQHGYRAFWISQSIFQSRRLRDRLLFIGWG